MQILSLLADFAAVAVRNAWLHAEMIRERDTLDAILHDTDDYVIVVDTNDCILFCNATARNAFGITRTDFVASRSIRSSAIPKCWRSSPKPRTS